MRILITAAIFNNTISMGARRPRAIAQLLAERGHDVTVIAAATDPNLAVPPPPGVRVLSPVPYANDVFKTGKELPFWKRVAVGLSVAATVPRKLFYSDRVTSLLRLNESEVKDKRKALGRRRYRTALDVKSLLEDHQWARESARVVAPQLQTHGPFDVVFSTYGPMGSLWLGEELLARGCGGKWVVDMRDPIASAEALLPVRTFLDVQRRRFVRRADAVTVVSQGILDSLLSEPGLARFRNKCSVVTNGFLRRTLDDAQVTAGPAKSDDTLKIAYTGMLYHGRRDPRPLFAAIKQVLRSDPSKKVRIDYAGKDSELIATIAQDFGLADCVSTHGIVPHSQALHLQDQADLLLALTWNEPDDKGVLSGKFLEYLGVGKPVISLVSGKAPDAELSKITEKTRIGIAVEEVEGPAGVERLANYLEEAATSKRQAGAVPFDPDAESIAAYDYEDIVTRLEETFARLTQPQEK